MDIEKYNGKAFALLLIAKKEDGEEEWAVFPGVARLRNGSLYLERSGNQPDVEIHSDWHERIRPVGEEERKILQGAQYCISLSVWDKPEGDDGSYLPIGLKWPE